MTKRHPFTLVEILLALGVIMIGVVSLMGLFPLATKVTTNANMETYATSAAEELYAFITEQALGTTTTGTTTTKNWSTWIVGSGSEIPEQEPSAMLENNEASHLAELEDNSQWQVISDQQKRIFKHRTKKGVFQLVSLRGSASTEDAIELDDEKIESRVLITVWKTPITRTFKEGPETDSAYAYGARLQMKVGWPAERREADEDGNPLRVIRCYSFDLLSTQDN